MTHDASQVAVFRFSEVSRARLRGVLHAQEDGWQSEAFLLLHAACPSAKVHFAGISTDPWLAEATKVLGQRPTTTPLHVVYERTDEVNYETQDMRKRAGRQQIPGLLVAEELRGFCAAVVKGQPATFRHFQAEEKSAISVGGASRRVFIGYTCSSLQSVHPGFLRDVCSNCLA